MTFEEEAVRQQVLEQLDRQRRVHVDRIAWRYRWKPRLLAVFALLRGR